MAIAYIGGYFVGRARDRRRRLLTAATIACLFVPLLVFKYTDFVYGDVLGPLFGWNGKILDAALPLGISFVTFTLAAYVVDISRDEFIAPARSSTVLAYVLFFPHLIAGPILRPRELIPQLAKPRPASLRRITVPLAIFTLGLVKKLVFADQIAEVVDPVFNTTQGAPSGNAALLAIYGFSVQIYCDFSGYTDMAIGLALLLGVRLPTNFLSPYCAHTLVDFWRRWHITLSRLARDLIYVPLALGGGVVTRAGALMLTMVVIGVWHGAGWTFVVWGALNGCFLWINQVWQALWGRRRGTAGGRLLACALTCTAFAVGCVFFRANDVESAWHLISAMACFGDGTGFEHGVLEWDDWLIGHGYVSEAFVRSWFGGTWTVVGTLWTAVALMIAWFVPDTMEIVNYREADAQSDWRRSVGSFGWQPTKVWLGITVTSGIVIITTLGRVSEFLYYQF
jgi:alginate O-acetyltransferase complex protein AlgI